MSFQWKENLQVFIPTSLSPWHPSTSIVEGTVADVRKLLRDEDKQEIEITIYCDGIPPWATEYEADAYMEYVDNLLDIGFGPVVMSPRRIGLVGLFKLFIGHFTKPVVLNIQHDWELPDPLRVEIERLIYCMVHEDDIVQVVRLHKRMLPQSGHKGYVDQEYHEYSREGFPPLIATDGWGDSPHFATNHHYRTRVLSNLDLDCGEDGRYGVEGPVWRAYHKDKRKLGFEKAQREWGSFLYGRFNEEPYVKHRGHAAVEWRAQKNLKVKR